MATSEDSSTSSGCGCDELTAIDLFQGEAPVNPGSAPPLMLAAPVVPRFGGLQEVCLQSPTIMASLSKRFLGLFATTSRGNLAKSLG